MSLLVSEKITIEMLDSLITCEIANPEEDKEVYGLVAMFMVHGPCITKPLKDLHAKQLVSCLQKTYQWEDYYEGKIQ